MLIKDPFPGISHGVGAVASVVALVTLLVMAAGRPVLTIAFAVYGVSLVLLFTASAVAHSVRCEPRLARRFDKFDYAAIYLLIAGTYTPFCLGPLRGPWGWSLLTAEWALAVSGIGIVYLASSFVRVRLALYVVMGWLAIVATVPILRVLPTPALMWLLAGGVFYSLGAIVFIVDRPHLWPGRFTAHDLWHVMVLAGSACHFVVIERFVA